MIQKFRNKYGYYPSTLWRLFKNRKSISNKKILVIQNTGLGDACQLIPFCRLIAQADYQVDVLAPESHQPLWEAFVAVHQYFKIPKIVDESTMNNKEYEAIFSASMNPQAVRLATLPMSNKRYGMVEGMHYYRGAFLFFNHMLHVQKNEHVTDRYCQLFRMHFPDFQWNEMTETVSNRAEQKIIGLHPGGKWGPRRWGMEKYFQLSQRLAEKGFCVRLFLHSSEPELVQFFKNQSLLDKVSTIQVKSVQMLMDEIKACSYFVGNDSGLSHLANLYHKPMTVIWGPGNLERVRPLGKNVQIILKDIDCRPCRQYVHPDRCERGENVCLQQISVDEVFEKVLSRIWKIK